MAYTVDPDFNILNIVSNSQLTSTSSSNLIGRKTEHRLLNTQARIEYELLKASILESVCQKNKLLELDDQIMSQEYKLCTSLSYRRQIFVIEFRQIPTDNKLYNHVLELIFQGSDRSSATSGRSKLVLDKDKSRFVWRQLDPNAGGPFGSSKVIASLVLRWLKDENGLFLRFAPV
jgi:hypothetical protein